MRASIIAPLVFCLTLTLLAGCTANAPANAPTDAAPVAASGCTTTTTLPPGVTTSLTLTVDGGVRAYAVHVPADAAIAPPSSGDVSAGRGATAGAARSPGATAGAVGGPGLGPDSSASPAAAAGAARTPLALILAFTAHGMPTTRLEAFSGLDDSEAVVVYPEPATSDAGDGWQGAPYSSGADDVGFTSALLDDVQGRLCIDPDRVFAVGISNGGGFVALLSCALPARIAAFAVVAGAIYPARNPACPAVSPVPVIEFHGTADPVIPFDGGASHGTELEPVTSWLDALADRNGCTGSEVVAVPNAQAERQTWNGCRGRGALVHYRVDGGGHTWPGAMEDSGPGDTDRALAATALIEAFFTAHPLP